MEALPGFVKLESAAQVEGIAVSLHPLVVEAVKGGKKDAEIKIEAEAKLNASGEVVVKVDNETNDVDKEKIEGAAAALAQLVEAVAKTIKKEVEAKIKVKAELDDKGTVVKLSVERKVEEGDVEETREVEVKLPK